jgi:[ribosomal protein S5]-alanine N-acetyltransferase
MAPQEPILITERLTLRLLSPTDAPWVTELAGDRRVYETTLSIPHPYLAGMAESWIVSSLVRFYAGDSVDFAITLAERGAEDNVLDTDRNGIIVGVISLIFDYRNQKAELGYWVGVPHWNLGYCTEAARAVIRYGFETHGLHKITSRHLVTNPASGRVMEKAGMTREGDLIDEAFKEGRFHTLRVYGILNEDHDGDFEAENEVPWTA